MSQRALFLTKVHGDFKVESRAIPKPGPDEVLVRVQATALNPVDWKIQGEFINSRKGIYSVSCYLAYSRLVNSDR